MRRPDPEMMEAIRERVERIRDYVPSEEFDETPAVMLAKREIGPLYSGEPGPVTIGSIQEPGETHGEF